MLSRYLNKKIKVIELNCKYYFIIPIALLGNITSQDVNMKCMQYHLAAGDRLEEVVLRCQELLFMITEQEPVLEFVLLHIYHYIFISDFWAKGQRVYCSTNQV